MERKFYTNDFERLLKEKSDEFRMYPSKRVWHSIYNDLHPSRKWPSVAMTMMLVIGLLLIGYFNTSDNTSSKPRIADNQASTASDKKTGTEQTNKNNPGSLNNKQSENDFSFSADENDPASSVNSNKGTSSANTDLPNNQDNAFTTTANKPSTTVQSNDQNNYNNTTIANNKNVIEAMDSYINSNQLLADVAILNKQSGKTRQVNGVDNNNTKPVETISSNLPENNNIVAPQNLVAGTALSNVATKDDKKTDKLTEPQAKKANLPLTDKINPNDEKSWMEDYVLHNKSARKKWKDHLEFEIYATPSIGYRRLENNAKPEATVSSFSSNAQPARDLNKSINQKPGLGLEAGVGLSYSFAKKFRLKVGAQFNYTSYTINADETNHPVLTTLLLNDINTNKSYLTSRTSTHSNSSGLDPVKLRNKTYQVSIPVGLAVKLAGNKKIEWFAGVSIQPTFVMGGKANLISSDYQNYVTEPSMLSKWNLNTGVETYINYKMGSYSIQVGPQLRYQVLSTYNKKYTIKENLYNAGLKVGIVKGF